MFSSQIIIIVGDWYYLAKNKKTNMICVMDIVYYPELLPTFCSVFIV